MNPQGRSPWYPPVSVGRCVGQPQRAKSFDFGSCGGRYMGHFINNAQVGKTAEWMIQSQRKLCQLQLKTCGNNTCVYFPSVRRFELRLQAPRLL
jgi:hypothetical protein